MKLRIMEENGALLVSVLGSRQQMVICEQNGGFEIELREINLQEKEVAPPVAVVPSAPSVAVAAPAASVVQFPSPLKEESVGSFDEILFKKLAALRKHLSAENNVPPYVIFHDKTLRAMVEARPESFEALSVIEGVGKAKLEKYGGQFLAVIHHHYGVGVAV